MNAVGSVSFLTIYLFIITVAIIVSADPQTKFLSVVFRHGDRAPDNNGDEGYPNDPYMNYEFSPEGYGGLTNTGKGREFTLGEKLREMYGDFLGNIYYPQAVNARSTDYDRTKMSLQLVMAGLFRPTKSQQWNSQLNWQPVVANFVPGILDAMMVPEGCPQYLVELEKVKKTPEVEAKLQKFSGFMKNLTELSGRPIKSANDMFNLYHTLMAEYAMNLTLPNWAYDIFPHGSLLEGIVLEYDIVSYNTALKRLNGGMLLRNITESMIDVYEGRMKNGRKLNLFSGHETNVAALLKTLGVYTPHVPEYSSAVIVELLGDAEGHYVKIRYYQGIPSRPITLYIPGCDELCPFEKFLTLMKDVLPSREEMVCQKEPLVNQKPTYFNSSRI